MPHETITVRPTDPGSQLGDIPTYKFWVWRSVAEVDSRDIEDVPHVVVGVARSVWINVVTFPLLPRQFQRYRLYCHDLACHTAYTCHVLAIQTAVSEALRSQPWTLKLSI